MVFIALLDWFAIAQDFFLKVRCNEPSTILSINILYSITLNSAVLWIKFGFVNL